MAQQISIHLPDDLYHRAKAAADQSHVSIAAVVRQALEAHLGDEARSREGLASVQALVAQVEQALDRVLVEAVRLADRVHGLGREVPR